MTNTFNKLIKMVIAVMAIIGMLLIFKNKLDKKEITADANGSKSIILKKYLLKFEKPERIEIFGLSDRYSKEINSLKKLKVAQDKASDFYITIKLFSDETDLKAPLVAQIQFIEIKSGNLRKEESINLE